MVGPTSFLSSLFKIQSLQIGKKIEMKSEMIENRGIMKKLEDRKVFNFPHLCLFERGEK